MQSSQTRNQLTSSPFAGHPPALRLPPVKIAGVLLVASVCALAPPPWPLVTLGVLLSVLVAMTWSERARSRDQARADTLLGTAFSLAHDRPLFDRYHDISQSFLRISQWANPVYREASLARLVETTAELQAVAAGVIVYEGTETWRIVYAKLLTSPGVQLYRSVARVKNRSYWQDEPGLQSMRLNFELQAAGRTQIERIAIIADELWPAADELPVEQLRQWIHEQYTHGIAIKLVRESALATEQDLVADIGIYGSMAVGTQELDAQCRTVRFALTFDFAAVAAAEKRWGRLSVYAAAYQDILDHFTIRE